MTAKSESEPVPKAGFMPCTEHGEICADRNIHRKCTIPTFSFLTCAPLPREWLGGFNMALVWLLRV
jgi:hypothetical protein